MWRDFVCRESVLCPGGVVVEVEVEVEGLLASGLFFEGWSAIDPHLLYCPELCGHAGSAN